MKRYDYEKENKWKKSKEVYKLFKAIYYAEPFGVSFQDLIYASGKNKSILSEQLSVLVKKSGYIDEIKEGRSKNYSLKTDFSINKSNPLGYSEGMFIMAAQTFEQLETMTKKSKLSPQAYSGKPDALKWIFD